MAASIAEHRGPWTWTDLRALDAHEGRLEIQDGNLVMSPQPTRKHQGVSARLLRTCAPQVEPQLTMIADVDLVLTETSVRVPDLVVIDSALTASSDAAPLSPAQIVVAVEIVSPGSRRTDRLVKPQEYAEAGIAGFWRVELEPEIRLTAYALADGEYVELGSWGPGERADVGTPLSLVVAIDDLVPPQ